MSNIYDLSMVEIGQFLRMPAATYQQAKAARPDENFDALDAVRNILTLDVAVKDIQAYLPHSLALDSFISSALQEKVPDLRRFYDDGGTGIPVVDNTILNKAGGPLLMLQLTQLSNKELALEEHPELSLCLALPTVQKDRFFQMCVGQLGIDKTLQLHETWAPLFQAFQEKNQVLVDIVKKLDVIAQQPTP